MKNILISFCLLLSLPSAAQELKPVKGRVLNDSIENSAIHIINLAQRTGTVTGKDGSFEILVREKDTLLFSSLLYVSKKIAISSEVLTGKPLIVKLESAVNELEEVNISNINLSGNLNNDISSIPLFDKYDLGIELSKKPPPTQAERRLMVSPVSFNPLGGAVNLEHLINLISGRHALNKLAKANQDLQILVMETQGIFAEDFYVKDLNIPSEEIIGFLYYCAEKAHLKEQISKRNDLQLMEYFKNQAAEFREFRELE